MVGVLIHLVIVYLWAGWIELLSFDLILMNMISNYIFICLLFFL